MSEAVLGPNSRGQVVEGPVGLAGLDSEAVASEERLEPFTSQDIIELVVECCGTPSVLPPMLARHASILSLLEGLGYSDSELEALLDLLQAAWLRLVNPISSPDMVRYARMKKRGLADIAALLGEEELAEILSILAAGERKCERETVLDILMRIADLADLEPDAQNYVSLLAERGTCSEVRSFASLLVAL